jgi:hypothetical protein
MVFRCNHDYVSDTEDAAPEGDTQSSADIVRNWCSYQSTNQGTNGKL